MASNYAEVLDQLRAAGLIVDNLETGRMVRCRVEGDREKRGWYSLHELQTTAGTTLIVGSFGVWRGSDNNAQKVELKRSDFTNEQRESLRRRLAEDRKRAERARKDANARAAERAARTWATLAPTGELDYLARKGVQAHGLRFAPGGAAAVPMLDAAGKIHGLQIIRSDVETRATRKRQKEYWPAGVATKGHFHLIGAPSWLVIVAEGYATAASIHEATGFPVAVAFDAGNLAPVASALRKRYKQARILIAADDDAFAKCAHCKERLLLTLAPTDCPSCAQPHGRSNAGVTAASSAALEVSGHWIRPQFAAALARDAAWLERGEKLTDFNDLHLAEGLHVVRTQVEARLTELRWAPRAGSARPTTTGGAGSSELKPIEQLDELLERFALVYGQGGTVFDHQEHCLISLSDMRDACISRELHRAWAEHPDRRIVRVREVGFDPGGEDPNVRCNLWAGWPTSPKAGKCDKLIELLRYMCSAERNSQQLFDWVLNWIAFPIQHPGAKMKTTLVLHGPQGTGKNLFFEALMAIYGQYGRVIDQSAIEDRFNDWASRKLFLIADEVVARSDLYHVKNKLKAFITGEWIRINPKNMAAYDERNHVNVVFLSNEAMPVVLEEDDRRHTVIWTPEKLGREFYRDVMDELANGGAAALHDYLLHHDLGDFDAGTLPPFTDAKAELISLGLDSPSRFFYDLTNGDIGAVLPRPCLSEDLYELYKLYTHRIGAKPAPMPKFVNALQRKHQVTTARKRYLLGSAARGPHTVVNVIGSEVPPGKSETAWLGEQIEAFKRSLNDFKGEK